MSDPSTPGTHHATEVGDVKSRRKALGWSRGELAERAGVDRAVMQLIELRQWDEAESHGRVAEVLWRAEHGEADVRLPPPEAPR